MIKSRKSRWAKFVFHGYVRRLMSNNFHQFSLLGDIPQTNTKLPLLLLPNHRTWWDGFFIYLLNDRILKRPLYLMMLESQLARYRFFSRVGAYSINPANAKSTLESLHYTLALMNEPTHPRSMICIFPQGELQPWDKRPLLFKRGIDWLIKAHACAVNVLPLSIRIEYRGHQRAEVFFLFGQNHIIDYHNFSGRSWLEQIECELLNSLKMKIINGEIGQCLLAGRLSIDEKIDRIFHRK